MLACNCALVSGLSQITARDDGGSDTDGSASDASTADTDAGGDARDSGTSRAGSALQVKTACATSSSPMISSSFSFSNASFTVSFWFRPDMPLMFSQEIHPIVWNGGRSTADPGWLIGIQFTSLVFCVADAGTFVCASAPGSLGVIGHQIHIVGVSAIAGGSRSLELWALDATTAESVHAMVAKAANLANSWTSTAVFTVGGVVANNGCTANVQGTIDDLRLWSTALAPTQFDANYKQTIPCNDPNLVGDFTFDEGMGTVAGNCTLKTQQLAITGSSTWIVPSPFP